MHKKRIAIIGAGLSGLYTASLLQEHYDVTLIEARKRIGGRIHSINTHDMGPSWIWPHHHKMLQLVNDYKLELFEQYTNGLALYDHPSGVQKFNAPPQGSSYRVVGGISALSSAIFRTLSQVTLHLDAEVKAITKEENSFSIQTQRKAFNCDYIISTLPPRVAVDTISYSPDLPLQQKMLMQTIPTWMGGSAKCVIEYKEAFWRDSGLSGFVFSPLGPLGEIHDACTKDTTALFGFVQNDANL
jgi:monoamine oxidase